jgi:signal transduction histidine kinase/CheY-like chemotaxis protein
MWPSKLLRRFLSLAAAFGVVLLLAGGALQWQLANSQSSASQVRFLIWGFTGLAVALVLLAGFLQERFFSSGIRRILAAMEETRQGRYPRLLAEGSDDTAKLIRGFNETVDELRNRDEKLKSWAGKRETELVRVSRTLEQERDKLGTVLDSIGDGVILLDGESRMLMANGRVSEIFGVPVETLTGAELGTLIEQVSHRLADPTAVEDKLRNLHRHPEDVHEITLQLDEPAGQAIRLYCAPVRGADGKVLSRIATSMDLGREREFDRLKAELLSTLSHELRTPLTSIKGSLGLVQGGAVGVISPEIQDLLSVALTNTDRLIRLTADILGGFELEGGQGGKRLVSVSLPNSLAQVMPFAASQAAQRKITLEGALPEDLPDVKGDPKRVEQLLVNLLFNAIKRSPPGRKVIVSARAENQKVVVSVEDSGRGMSKGLLDRLSGTFKPTEGTATLQDQEAGLRLDICRRVIDSHGGRIWAESDREGGGSTVHFSLPVPGPSAVTKRADGASGEGQSAASRLILVVDGDETVVRLISCAFKSQGYRVISSHSGREAIELAREHHPDMLTLDLAVADMDGYAVLQELRGNEETRNIPIVCISTHTDSSPAIRNGANFYLLKPLDMEKLRAVAERTLAID